MEKHMVRVYAIYYMESDKEALNILKQGEEILVKVNALKGSEATTPYDGEDRNDVFNLFVGNDKIILVILTGF